MESNKLIQTVSHAALRALLYEVALTPKPGLVDKNNNGSHQDMDFYTFIDSSLALAPFFTEYAQTGYTYKDDKLSGLFSLLRQTGIEAERAMFEATGGVNTHKGANFSLALILGATTFFLKESQASLPLSLENVHSILTIIQRMVEKPLRADFKAIENKPPHQWTHGERLYIEQGIKGVRGEALNGYPILLDVVLPHFQKQKKKPHEQVMLEVFVLLMAQLEDSNILHRGGVEGWHYVKNRAQSFIEYFNDAEKLRMHLNTFDQELISRFLSPGGAADMMILGLYFAQLMGLFTK